MPVTSAGGGVPAGTIAYFAANAAPAGFLKANGAVVSRATYAGLFAAIGSTFGGGDGSTTFSLPDLRGEFPRGWDDGRGLDVGRALGTVQAQDVQGHAHTVPNSGGAHNAPLTNGPLAASSGFNGTSTTATSAVGGSETRPRNIAMLACIKF